jgi:serine/threonine protein kinase
MVSRASAASFVFIVTVVDQCPGKQRWICSTACLRTTLSLGAGLPMLDNSLVPDNTPVKKAHQKRASGRKTPRDPERNADTNSGKVWVRLMAKHGRYNIVRRVADGGMAEIFLATQVGRDGFQKPVILKRIHSTIYADPQFRNMFVDEAHISMSLAHSNIAQVLDLGVAAGRYFLVLELVDGWDLGRVLQRAAAAGTSLPRELGMHITADVCRALAYAHGKTDGQRALGIVHRDVSPHNVLLSEQGEVKLTDFGIAKAMNKREQTGTGVVKGKVAFMSPEQAMGKPIDQRSDIFSLGTMLYLLMARARPFEGPTDLETLLRVQKGEFVPPEAAAPDLEPEVAAIINRAMRMDPAERYQSADDMLTDLERVLRTVFQPVGQTELKRWLAELHAHDGHPPIGKAPERPTTGRVGTGEIEEGKDVVLSDSQDDEEEVIDGEAATSVAVVQGGGGAGRMRLSRHRAVQATPALPVPRDAEAELEGRPSQELALPIPDTEEPPDRRRARGGGGVFKILMVGVILVGGAWVVGRYYRVWFGDGEAGTETGAGPTTTTPTPAPKTTPTPAPTPTPKKSEAARTPPPPEEATKTKSAGAAPPDPRAAAAEPVETAAKAERTPPARESGTRRRKEPPIKVKGPDLKSMMAPDPSQLPEAPPRPAPSEPAPAPSAPEEP